MIHRDPLGIVTITDATPPQPMTPPEGASWFDYTESLRRRIKPEAGPRTIIAAVCRHEGVAMNAVIERGRHPSIVHARESIVGVMRAITLLSFPEITRAMCRTTHSTIIDQHRRWMERPADQRAALLEAVARRIETT